jgi:hypothetical protein
MSLALKGVYPLPETTACTPSLAVHNDLVFLAWKGEGNQRFSISISDDGGRSYRHKYTTTEEQTDRSPSIASHDGKVYIAWKGVDNRSLLNIAQLELSVDEHGETYIKKMTAKNTYHDVSITAGPALTSHEDHLWVAFKPRAGTWVTIGRVEPGVNSTSSKFVQVQNLMQAVEWQPSLVSHNGVLVASWKGVNNVFKVARMTVTKSETDGRPVVNRSNFWVFSQNQRAWMTPSMASASEAGLLYLGWAGFGKDAWINLTMSSDNGTSFVSPNKVGYSTHAGVSLAWFKDHLIVAWSEGNSLLSHTMMVGRTKKLAAPIRSPTLTPATKDLKDLKDLPMPSLYGGSETDLGEEVNLSSGMQTPRTSTCGDDWILD